MIPYILQLFLFFDQIDEVVGAVLTVQVGYAGAVVPYHHVVTVGGRVKDQAHRAVFLAVFNGIDDQVADNAFEFFFIGLQACLVACFVFTTY